MNSKIVSRHTGLDIIRCVALFSVISVHFFLNTGFYDKPIIGKTMLVMVIMRSSFIICVPLFMMLTGYLSQAKDINAKYYFKINRVLFIYILSSLLCGFYKKWVLHTGTTIPRILLRILSFESAPYSWYIEMYIGLFLIIPFLNILYDGLATQKNKRILIITFLVLTALPSILNIYCISGIDWWLMPSIRDKYSKLFPAWWQSLYPITYFYLGKYLREFPLKKSHFQKIIYALLIFLFAGLFNYYRSYGSVFVTGRWQDYGSLLITCQTVLVFSLFADINYDNMPATLKHLFATVSDLSLGAYLTSWILDQWFYYHLYKTATNLSQQLYNFLIAVFVILTGSLFLSAGINILYSIFSKTVLQRIQNKYLTN